MSHFRFINIQRLSLQVTNFLRLKASAPKHPLRHTLRKKVENFPSLKIPSGKQFIRMVHYFGEKWKRVLQGFTLVFKLRAGQVGCSNVAGRKPALITRVPSIGA